MNDRGLRQQILVRSVQRLLPDDEQVTDVVVLWNRHRWFYPYCAAAGLVLFVLSLAIGIQGPVNQIALACCGVAVAAMSTTNYWILARTTAGFALFRSSRIRQYAKALSTRLGQDPGISMVGSTVITSDWSVNGTEYTMTKRWESTMRSFT